MKSDRNLDAELKDAYEAQQARVEKVRASVGELEDVHRQGQRTRSWIVRLAAALGMVLLAVTSWIMFSDPSARVLWGVVLFIVVLGGIHSYWRKTAGV